MKDFAERISCLWACLKPSSLDVQIFVVILCIIVFGLRYTDISIFIGYLFFIAAPLFIWIVYKFPKPMSMLFMLIALEQSALYFITNRLLSNDNIFYEYLNSLPNPYLVKGYKNDCKGYSIAYIYEYELCTFKGGRDESPKFEMRIKHPPAYITLLSPYYDDRFIMFGSYVMLFDQRLHVLEFNRKK